MATATNSSALSDTEYEMVSHIINIKDKEFENLKWSKCCIYRVPRNLRKVNMEAYTPQLISIGPLHYGRKELKPMQNQKKKYFHFFWERVSNEQVLKSYKAYLEEEEKKIRHCYAVEFRCIGKDKFVDMMLLDAVFIMEHFLRATSSFKSDKSRYEEGNYMDSESFRRRHSDVYILTQAWLSKSIHRDLLMLENQLPVFVLNKLYDDIVPDDNKKPGHHCFLHLAHEYFAFAFYDTQKSSLDETKPVKKWEESKQKSKESIHFTDLIRYFYLPSVPTLQENMESSEKSSGKKGAFTCSGKYFGCGKPSRSILRTATKLQGAGVSFEKDMEKRLLDIKFDKKPILSWFLCLGCIPRFKYFKARLQIPQLKVDHTTECILRNLIAFEQCHYPLEPYISNYVSLIDSLIHTKDDVELLVEKEVIVHELGSDKEVATLVNGLCKHVVTNNTTYYLNVIDVLNKHYQNFWNRAMAALRLVYFRDPWRASSTVVGIAVLVFTIFSFCRVVRLLF